MFSKHNGDMALDLVERYGAGLDPPALEPNPVAVGQHRTEGLTDFRKEIDFRRAHVKHALNFRLSRANGCIDFN